MTDNKNEVNFIGGYWVGYLHCKDIDYTEKCSLSVVIFVSYFSKITASMCSEFQLLFLNFVEVNKSRNEVPKGYHLHYDELNSLVDGSVEFIFGRAISSPISQHFRPSLAASKCFA